MSLLDAAILLIAAFFAGVMNSIAGGGSFLTFPSLVFTGVTEKLANATNTVALWPASIAAARAYQRELRTIGRSLIPVSIVSTIGGFAGAQLLLLTSEESFRQLVPWLLLVATLVFAIGPYLTRFIRQRKGAVPVALPDHGFRVNLATLVLQFVIAIYGGYFGGGIGILMLAALSITMDDIQLMNAVKNWLATCINGIAVIAFIVSGAVLWPQALVMIVGATLGGYSGASVARRLNQQVVRTCVLVIGFVLTAYYFYTTYA